MLCDLYFRNTWTQLAITNEIRTYGELQAFILNQCALSLTNFQALLFNHHVIGEHLIFDQEIETNDTRFITSSLQLIVNYFPIRTSRLSNDFREWLHHKVTHPPTSLALNYLYLRILVPDPMTPLGRILNFQQNGRSPGPLSGRSGTRSVPSRTQSTIPAFSDLIYYQFYNDEPTESTTSNEASSTNEANTASTASSANEANEANEANASSSTTYSNTALGDLMNTLPSVFSGVWSTNTDAYASLIDHLETLAPTVRVTLSETELERLRVERISESNRNGLCTICRQEYQINDRARYLPCEHYFHKVCVDRWLTEQSVKCPICRWDTRNTRNTQTDDSVNNSQTEEQI